MKVLILIPTRLFVEPDCLASVNNQTHADYSVCIHALAPIQLHIESEKNRVLNVVRNRNMMRDMALKTDAEWFMWVDSDTVIPPSAIATFLKYKKPLMGGWYKKKDGSVWVAGSFIPNGLFQFYKEQPADAELPVDLLGLGCAFMHRDVLEKIEFDPGITKDMTDTSGASFFYAECAMLCESAKKIGITPLLIKDVVCRHLPVLT